MPTLVAVANWQSSPENLSLKGGQIDLWQLALDALPCTPDCLDELEHARYERFRTAGDRQQYCTAHSALRKVLGRYLDCFPGEVPIAINHGGKPRIDRRPLPLYFNLSHTANTALLGIRLGHPIGIDIEVARELPNFDRLAQRAFRKNEIEQLKLSDWNTQLFYALWTRMEARQKCLGRGVFGRAAGEQEIQTLDIEPGGGHYAALAWPIEARPEYLNYYQLEA